MSKADARELIGQFQAGLGSPRGSALHPLLQQNTSDLSEQRFTSTFTGHEFFLADHVVAGRRVLPCVAYLEMARAAVEQAAGWHGGVRLKDLVWPHPLTAEGEPVRVHLGLFPEENGELAFEVYGGSGVHGQGRAARASPTDAPFLELAALKARCPPTLAAEALYEAYRSIGIDYGPGHRGVVQLHAGAGTVLAELQLPASVQGSPSDFYLHPSLMDSALQACAGLWIAAGEMRPAMPFAISEVELFGPCTSRMWALIRASGGKLRTHDIDLCDAEGRIRVRIRGYAVRATGEGPRAAQAPAVAAAAALPVAAGQGGDTLQDKVIYHLKGVLAGFLQVPIDRIDADGSMDRYGLDSIMVMQLTSELERTFGTLPKTLLFEYQSIRELSGYFLDGYRERLLGELLGDEAPRAPAPQAEPSPEPAAAPQATASPRRRGRFGSLQAAAPQGPADIAIIGVAGRFPKARNLDELWLNLREGRDCLTEIPRERWEHQAYFDEDKDKPGKTYTKWGGFIDDVDRFDPLFFNISPREAELMDPQERLFLECVYEALEDAGYTRDALQSLKGSGMPGNVGVYVGVMYEEYQLFGAQEQVLGRPIAIPGNPSSIANRVSYFCNFHGPSMAVDTMCSSSLTAIHLACRSLRRGECELAIAGGVNVSIHPNKYLFLGQGKFASSTGRCESFGVGGDGYVPGEGVGAVLLKPLDRAIADGDQIHGVIKATAVNHGGHTSGYTVPNPNAQADVVERALKESCIAPERISYVEAHGTGTALGDPIEIAGLTKAFRRHTDSKQFCAIGSVKSNIGHCESAAGMAGLCKVLLQFKHGQLAPSLHSRTLNPLIDFASSPFHVQQQLGAWKRPTIERHGAIEELPRAAGISSFGAGGSNGHLIVEEFMPQAAEERPVAASLPAAIVLSAKDEDRLIERARRLLHAIRTRPVSEADLLDIAYTLQIGREAMTERLGLLVRSPQDLQDKLSRFIAGDVDLPDVVRAQVRRNKEGTPPPAPGDALSAREAVERWCNGDAVDWKRLYGGWQPRRVSLPTYPFARERHWLPQLVPGASLAVSSGLPAGSALHPLLHRNTSTLSELRFTSHFTGREFFFAGPAGEGERALAGVTFLEMARAAAERATGASVVQLRDVAWAPAVSGAPPAPIHVAVFPGDEREVLYEIYSQPVEGGESSLIRSQGRALLGAAVQAPVVDLRALQAGLAPVDAGGDAGGVPELERLLAGGDRVVARLNLPPALAEVASSYVLHPALLGAALQAAAGGARRTVVPHALDRVEIFCACPASIWAVIRVSERRADIDLCDPNGTVCVRIEGLAFHLVDGAAETRAPERGTLLLEPVWTERPVPPQADVPVYAKRLVILCEVDSVAPERIRSELDGAHCTALRAGSQGKAERFAQHAVELFDQIRAILEDRSAGKALLQVVVPNGDEEPLLRGLSGLLQTAQQENPRLVGQVIGVDPGDVERLSEKLDADSRAPHDLQIRYRNGKRLVAGWAPVRGAPSPSRVPWKDRGVYLITGGAGGLGLLFAEEIARTVRNATLFLTGRSTLDEARQARLAGMRELGATVVYQQADVADKASVERLIRDIEAESGALDGILHCAGVNRDNYIIRKTRAEFQEVVAPKVAGAVHLDEATRHLRMDFFVLFASLAGALGNPGQADYAFANAFLDGYAAHLNQEVARGRRSGRALAVDWPLWKEGGMHVDAAVERLLEENLGLGSLRTPAGIQALYDSMSSGADQVLVLEGDVERLRRRLLGAPAPAATERERRPVAHAERALLRDKVIHRLKGLLGEVAKLSVQRIDADEPLESYGIDSVMIAKLNQQLSGVFGELSKTLLFEYQALSPLSDYLLREHAPACERWAGLESQAPAVHAAPARAESELPNLTPLRRGLARSAGQTDVGTRREPIAIIGMSGRYPQAPDLRAFWMNLASGKDCVGEVPSDRWPLEGFFVPDAERAVEGRKSYSKWGGFLEGFDQFDPLFFNITPLELLNIDPQERLFLESCWSLLEEAGYTREQLAARFGGRVGVFAGITKTGFELYGPDLWRQGQALSPRTSFSSVANRVSYLLNLRGPSLAVDTMCSSSLVAIHEACEHLHRGECELAIAGGVNLYLHPATYVELCAHRMLSADGHCKSFGEGGDGFVPGEGVGTVLLKPLSKALRDQDRIYALVRGTLTNHGGKTNGYTVPNPVAQGDLIREALDKAGVNARAVSYVEAHGTGTKLGDPIEITGLTQAFQKDTKETGYCSIGSVKSNIGHLEAAAGIAGVAKIVLQMQHGQLVPSLHARRLNPNISFERTPFVVQQELAAWERPRLEVSGRLRESPRIAGISSFGAGGSNAHVILEEYIPPERPPAVAVTRANPAIVVLSAKNRERLEEYARRMVAAIRSGAYTDAELSDLAYTLQVGREAMDERLALLCGSLQELEEKLQAFLDGKEAIEDAFHGQVKRNQATVTLVSNDEDMLEAIDRWVEKRKLAKLLDLWVKGLAFDWNRIYGERKPRRIGVPTYPFAKERYWLPQVNAAAVGRGTSGTATLHPILHRNTSDLLQQRFSSTFTGQESFLADHLVGGEKVLPGVAYLEMARAAVDASAGFMKNEGTAVQLRDVVWSRPLVVGAEPVAVEISLALDDSGRSISFEISTKSDARGGSRLHCQGSALFAPADHGPVLNLAELRSACNRGIISSERVYGAFKAMGIDYGPVHRGVKEVHVGAEEMLAKLSLPAELWEDGRYVIHPGMLDSAVQASLAFLLMDAGSEASREPIMPFELKEVEILGPCAASMWAYIALADGARATGKAPKINIDLCDEQGRIAVRIKGLSSRVLKGGSSVQADARTIALTPIWEAFAPQRVRHLPPPSARVWVVGGTAAQVDEIKRRFPRAHGLDVEAADTVSNVTRELEAHGALDHLVWIAPESPIASLADESIMREQARGVLPLFRTVKALLALGYEARELGWTVVTTRAQLVHRDDTVNPTHASVHGFIGSMAKELPSWKVRLLDVAGDWSVDDLLTLPSDPQGDALACRADQWYRQRLVPLTGLSRERDLYRQGGVYVVIGGAGGIGEIWTEHMIRTYRAQVVWIGRREMDARIQAQLDRLAQPGPAPIYIAADATDREALRGAYEQIKQRHPHIHGLVHSALVLQDKSLLHMDEERFKAGLAPKVDATVRMAQVFAAEPLDFVLYFSSMSAFVKAAGQSNYSAGCTFKDAYALRMGREWPCAVKVMDWGYWGTVGIVASEEYQSRMAQQGVGSIEPPEAMRALDALLAGPVDQMAFMKAIDAERIYQRFGAETIEAYPETTASAIEGMKASIALPRVPEVSDSRDLDELLTKLLWLQLRSIGLFAETRTAIADLKAKLHGMYGRWLEETIAALARGRYLTFDETHCFHGGTTQLDGGAAWSAWDEHMRSWVQDPNRRTQVLLLDATMRALPDIVLGKVPATDVLFPNASMELVEGIYKHNETAEYFNAALANVIVAYIEERLKGDPSTRIRIFEIGAGTGATSSLLLRNLKPYHASIQEYCYTDLSRAFLLHAERAYGPESPFLTYKIFDASEPLAGQGIDAGQYDVVVAANVLHATRNIRSTLRNAKAVLRRNGLIVLNEIIRNNLTFHLTFGLTEGWWLHEDAEVRIPGSPALDPASWKRVLETEGLRPVLFPAEAADHLGSQIIVAESDGIVRQRRAANRDAAQPEPSRPRRERQTKRATKVKVEVAAPRGVVSDELLREKSVAFFKELIGETLMIPSHKIDPAEPFEGYGIDSILVVRLTSVLRKYMDDVSSTLFFECQTIDALVEHFMKTGRAALMKLAGGQEEPGELDVEEEGEEQDAGAPVETPAIARSTARAAAPSVVTSARGEPQPVAAQAVAIIGISGRYPGAKNVAEFWRNLKEGRNCIREIPDGRWDWRAYFDQERGKPGSIYTRWGGFVEDIDKFDPLFFKLSPRDAESMDPQERLFLEVAYECMQDAGYTPDAISASRKVGVFAGVMNGVYPTGANYFSIANRVSYLFNFQGPSLAVDTACSASLTAIHLALESLYSGTSDCAIAGGVNLILDPVHFIKLSQLRMLSSGDQLRAFGDRADGFVDGEGVGAVLLKPLEKAVADKDRIYGVIKGSMINAGGKTNGYSVPNPDAQARVVADCLLRAGVDARAVSYVEAHGTGTSLGDPIEIAGLTKAFGAYTRARQFCAIGSVKANIGHCESAAGIAGLTKVLMQMKFGQVAPSIHADVLNPNIDFPKTPFTVPQQLAEWKRPVLEQDGARREYPRIAGISSFGAGGANAHLIVEEYVTHEGRSRWTFDRDRPALIVLSAKNRARLQELVERFVDAIREGQWSDEDLADVAYTLQVGREAMEERLALTCVSTREMEEKLTAFLAGSETVAGLFVGQARRNQPSEGLVESGSGRHAEVLDRWVKGGSFDWNKLYGGRVPRRIGLPTYPFARERYWVRPEEELLLSAASRRVSPGSPSLAPAPAAVSPPLVGEEPPTGFEQLLQAVPPAAAEAPNEAPVTERPRMRPQGEVSAEIRRWLRDILTAELRLSAGQLEEDKPFDEYGVDSIVLAQVVHSLAKRVSANMSPSLLLEHTSIAALTEYFEAHHAGAFASPSSPAPAVEAPPAPATEPPPVPATEPPPVPAVAAPASAQPARAVAPIDEVAVVGLACRMPGGPNKEAYWRLLTSGESAIRPIAADRQTTRGDRVDHGGWMDDVDRFDPAFFNIRDEDAAIMDPQARIILEESLAAIYDAGYEHKELSGARIGVYIGGRSQPNADTKSVYAAPNPVLGTGQNYLATNISRFFNFRGPSMVVDTACSSGLAGMSIASDALKSGRIDMALVGAVSVLHTQDAHDLFAARNILNRNGKFDIFDKGSTGEVLGEGAGVVVLKRLRDAVRDGDQIYCVIRSIASNNDGRTVGPGSPNPAAQRQVIQEALSEASKGPEDVGYIEVNGGGSPVVDTIEIKALSEAYRLDDPTLPPCPIGSVKPNVGHLLSTSAMAGFIRCVLSISRAEIPPFLSARQPFHHYDWASSRIEFNREKTPWRAAPGKTRVAALSSFPDGGTNFHVLLEEFVANGGYRQEKQPLAPPKLSRKSFPLRQANRETIRDACSSIKNVWGDYRESSL
ncbi:SDR family NAD(P)-dependent oxidoreductase [Sorangium sp. So ce136]|uniref:SDR family NAD(P)-dependent oxidoreductase n=1 Tax=Sorangium sp. So ce136 TaxID=3133284 RepID=UPI003F122F7B